MVKVKKGLLVITLVSLIMLSIRPFSVYADTISSSNIIGVEYSIESYTTLEPDTISINGSKYCNVDFTIKAKVKLDNNYFGLINGTLTTNYYGYQINNNVAEAVVSTYNATKDFYVNGNEFNYSFTLRTKVLINSNIQSPIVNGYFSVISSDVILKNENMHQWNIPIESFSAILQVNQQIQPIDILNTNYYNYPIFNVNTNTLLFKSYYVNQERYDTYIICMGNFSISNINRINDYFSFSTNEIQLSEFQILNVFKDNNNTFWYTIKFRLHLTSSQDQDIRIYPKSSYKFVPIYYNRVPFSKYVSTEFALQYGLTNDFLENIGIIAQGTQQSNNSASSLESSTSSFSSTASDVYNVEDQVSSGFSSSMQNIPSSFNFQNNFGSSFVVSASWVRDQFNNLTANNPFGTLITFSLILGVALLIIGRLLS